MRMCCCFVLGTVLCLAGCGGPAKGRVLGSVPDGKPQTILAVKSGDTPPLVTLEGVLVEKCPVAGCWFRLRDQTDVIKIDTKAAGFSVTQIPLKTKITLRGKVAQEGAETIIAASGLRY